MEYHKLAFMMHPWSSSSLLSPKIVPNTLANLFSWWSVFFVERIISMNRKRFSTMSSIEWSSSPAFQRLSILMWVSLALVLMYRFEGWHLSVVGSRYFWISFYMPRVQIWPKCFPELLAFNTTECIYPSPMWRICVEFARYELLAWNRQNYETNSLKKYFRLV